MRPSERGIITVEQAEWIGLRDQVGALLDGRLRARPEPRERLAIALIEDALREGDRAVRLP